MDSGQGNCPQCGRPIDGSQPGGSARTGPGPADDSTTVRVAVPDPDAKPVGTLAGGGSRWFTHRPGAYSSVLWWLTAGITRDWRGTIAALVAAWFGLPTAILLGLVAAASAGVVGYFGSTQLAADRLADVPVLGDVLNTLAGNVGGGLGALLGIALGIVVGGVGGLLLPWAMAYADDPVVTILVVLLQVVLAIVIGLLYVLYGVALEPWRMRLSGARRLSRREADLLLPLLHECADRLGLPNVPRLLVDDTREAQALAYTRHIVVTRGLLDEFDYDPAVISGVLSHELVHWHNADGVSRLLVRGIALPLYLPYAAATWVLRAFHNSIVRFLAVLVSWPIAAAVRFFVMPLQAAGSREAEYRADQGAVLARQRDGLRQALERFRRSFDGSRNGWDEAVCASHPPNELRLEQLEEPGRRYPLPQARRRQRPAPTTGGTAGADRTEAVVPAQRGTEREGQR
ncbi:M48 family metalloprotease [Micromonospora sp. NPDC049559]|uniref:M48 family metalloprotease n=1 Tax=Micromonospora sp. NPDC049559 TaxID=3155923 RepID=UPI003443CFDA